MKKCTYCGKEAPDDATVCPLDGEPVVDPAAPPKPEEQPAKKEGGLGALRRVGGLLRFYVVVRIYLAPFFAVLSFILVLASGGIVRSFLFIEAVHILLTIAGIQVGIALRDIKPKAVQAVKGWLIAVLVWGIISAFILFFCGLPSQLLLQETIMPLISFAIWYSYFKVSKRVRATYPDWAQK
jgi:hypothetical protein